MKSNRKKRGKMRPKLAGGRRRRGGGRRGGTRRGKSKGIEDREDRGEDLKTDGNIFSFGWFPTNAPEKKY